MIAECLASVFLVSLLTSPDKLSGTLKLNVESYNWCFYLCFYVLPFLNAFLSYTPLRPGVYISANPSFLKAEINRPASIFLLTFLGFCVCTCVNPLWI